MAKRTYRVEGDVILHFSFNVEANSLDKAHALGEKFMKENYLTEQPDDVSVDVADVMNLEEF